MEVRARVQYISTETIPIEFIRPENERPEITTIVDEADFKVPVINLDNPDEERLVRLIANASSEVGLFHIINHGIPSEVIEKMQKVGKEFFELPQKEKEKYAKLPGTVEGYGTGPHNDDGGKKGVKKGWADHLFHNFWPPFTINLKFWPNNPPNYREVTKEYTKCMRIAGDKILRYLSLGLGLEEHELKEGAGGDEIEYLMKTNYYPPCPRPDLALGIPAHSDMCTITLLLFTNKPGLQIRNDQRWCNVNYVPNAVLVLIGDQVEIMSNGKCKAVIHRVTVAKDGERFSWAMFFEPPSEHVVGPISKLITDENPAKYEGKKFVDYAFRKFSKVLQQ